MWNEMAEEGETASFYESMDFLRDQFSARFFEHPLKTTCLGDFLYQNCISAFELVIKRLVKNDLFEEDHRNFMRYFIALYVSVHQSYGISDRVDLFMTFFDSERSFTREEQREMLEKSRQPLQKMKLFGFTELLSMHTKYCIRENLKRLVKVVSQIFTTDVLDIINGKNLLFSGKFTFIARGHGTAPGRYAGAYPERRSRTQLCLDE